MSQDWLPDEEFRRRKCAGTSSQFPSIPASASSQATGNGVFDQYRTQPISPKYEGDSAVVYSLSINPVSKLLCMLDDCHLGRLGHVPNGSDLNCIHNSRIEQPWILGHEMEGLMAKCRIA